MGKETARRRLFVRIPAILSGDSDDVVHPRETGDATHISRSFCGFLGAAGLAWANGPAQHGFQGVQERRAS